MDAFIGLPNGIAGVNSDLAHIVVVERPGWTPQFKATGPALPERRLRRQPPAQPRPVASCCAGGQLQIASSAIRSLIAAGGDPRFLVPDSVRKLIQANRIYLRPKEVQSRA
jgi:nicotinate-nucleotide adenylyltransferase